MVNAVINVPDFYYGWISRCFTLFGFLATVLTLSWHVYTVRSKFDSSTLARPKSVASGSARSRNNSAHSRNGSSNNGGSNQRTKPIKWTYSLTFSLVLQISVLIFTFICCYASFFMQPNIVSCQIAIIPTVLLYLIVKWALYMTLSYRLDAAFHGSAYQYKLSTLRILRVGLTLGVILELVLAYFQVKIEIIDEYNIFPCRGGGDTTILGITVLLMDTIAGFINVYLFVSPLKKIHKAVFDTDIEAKRRIFNYNANININNRSEKSSSRREESLSGTLTISYSNQKSAGIEDSNDNNNNNNNTNNNNLNNSKNNKNEVKSNTNSVDCGNYKSSLNYNNTDGNTSISTIQETKLFSVNSKSANTRNNTNCNNTPRVVNVASESGNGKLDGSDNENSCDMGRARGGSKGLNLKAQISTGSRSRAISVGSKNAATEKRVKKFLALVKKSTVLTTIAVVFTLLVLVLNFFIGMSYAWYVTL